MTAGGHGAVLAAGRQQLPALPAATATLVPAADGAASALAVHRSTLSVWQLASLGGTWTRAQAINVRSSTAPQAEAANAVRPVRAPHTLASFSRRLATRSRISSRIGRISSSVLPAGRLVPAALQRMAGLPSVPVG